MTARNEDVKISAALQPSMKPHSDGKIEEKLPTVSHALAEASVTIPEGQLDDSVAGQMRQHGQDWNDETAGIQPLVGGINNDEVWTLIRRFNKQVFRVKSTDERPLTALDMNVAAGEDVSPERLRAHMERLYMTVITALYSFHKQIIRLRSWREKPRTLSFLAAYTLAWLTDLLAPALVAFLIILIIYPPARDSCFPPAPPSLIDAKTGGIQTPLAGELASDSITGAPEKHRGEAVEQEAHSFVKDIGKLMMSVTSGKHPEGDHHQDIAPDPTKMAEDIADARDKTEGQDPSVEHDRTKEPVSRAVKSFEVRVAMHTLSDFIDSWERFGNAFSPTPPFALHRPRLTVAACLLPLMMVLCLSTWYAIMKALGFAIGLGFFGSPIITPCLAFLDKTCPGWRRYTELRCAVLRGVPTNAQLTITILRIGERNNSPLPPPPDGHGPRCAQQRVEARDLDHLGASREEIQAAIDPEPGRKDSEDEDERKPKMPRRIAESIKRTAKGSVRSILKVNDAKTSAGEERAKDRHGDPGASAPNAAAGLGRFRARYKGKKGYAYITTTATTPAVSWRSETENLASAWAVTLADVTELRKVGGLGWKSKIVAGLLLGREVADGLAMKTKDGEFYLSAVSFRDEMFNRLVSIGGQMWEVW